MSTSDCVYGVFVTLIFFSCMLLFSGSGKCNDVNQKSMFCESCPISVGNFKHFFFKTWTWKHFVSKLCSAYRQMNKVYKKYNFCIPSLNMTGATHFWLFSIEILRFPWQWWLHKLWAVLAVNKQVMMMSWCLMSSDVIWHIRDKLWPMPKHGSIKSTYVRCMRV